MRRRNGSDEGLRRLERLAAGGDARAVYQLAVELERRDRAAERLHEQMDMALRFGDAGVQPLDVFQIEDAIRAALVSNTGQVRPIITPQREGVFAGVDAFAFTSDLHGGAPMMSLRFGRIYPHRGWVEHERGPWHHIVVPREVAERWLILRQGQSGELPGANPQDEEMRRLERLVAEGDVVAAQRLAAMKQRIRRPPPRAGAAIRHLGSMLERLRARHISPALDVSALSQQFVPFLESGERIRVRTKYGEEFTGVVGMTGGWRPSFMLLSTPRSHASSILLSDEDEILSVRRGRRYFENPQDEEIRELWRRSSEGDPVASERLRAHMSRLGVTQAEVAVLCATRFAAGAGFMWLPEWWLKGVLSRFVRHVVHRSRGTHASPTGPSLSMPRETDKAVRSLVRRGWLDVNPGGRGRPVRTYRLTQEGYFWSQACHGFELLPWDWRSTFPEREGQNPVELGAAVMNGIAGAMAFEAASRFLDGGRRRRNPGGQDEELRHLERRLRLGERLLPQERRRLHRLRRMAGLPSDLWRPAIEFGRRGRGLAEKWEIAIEHGPDFDVVIPRASENDPYLVLGYAVEALPAQWAHTVQSRTDQVYRASPNEWHFYDEVGDYVAIVRRKKARSAAPRVTSP